MIYHFKVTQEQYPLLFKGLAKLTIEEGALFYQNLQQQWAQQEAAHQARKKKTPPPE